MYHSIVIYCLWLVINADDVYTIIVFHIYFDMCRGVCLCGGGGEGMCVFIDFV